MTLLLGFDVGSSSIKATLLDADNGKVVASATSPERELDIQALQPGWAEQDPEVWWEHVTAATAQIREQTDADLSDVLAIGISYQMHGLVLVDRDQRPLRPSIIWCDSRAVEIGERAADAIGRETCLKKFLNFPGIFTATKLRWVIENEPELFSKVHKMMLPGEYIAMKLTGEIVTTPSGLSEAILWDFPGQKVASEVLEHFEIPEEILPEVKPIFGVQGEMTERAAKYLGLKPGTPVTYRAGDQPNNAFSLNVLSPGQLATTAGTSGVVYGINGTAGYDPKSRVNSFVHVNHTAEAPRYGVLLCVSGTGILYSWLKHHFVQEGIDYDEMNALAAKAPVGSDGLSLFPFGNGAERTLENRNPGAMVRGWQFATHRREHFLRAAQEGIAFALNYGVGIMQQMGLEVNTVRAGQANMFLSPLFREVFSTVTGATVELYDTDGSQGAARGAGVGVGIYEDPAEAHVGLEALQVIEPNAELAGQYQEAYQRWEGFLKSELGE